MGLSCRVGFKEGIRKVFLEEAQLVGVMLGFQAQNLQQWRDLGLNLGEDARVLAMATEIVQLRLCKPSAPQGSK